VSLSPPARSFEKTFTHVMISRSQAETLITPIPLPLSMLASTSSGPASSSGYANGSGGGHRGDVQL